MFYLKKLLFIFFILLITSSSLFARGKKDVIEEDSHVIDTYQAFSEENQTTDEEVEINEITITNDESEVLENESDFSQKISEETNNSELQTETSEENLDKNIQTENIEEIELEVTKDEEEIIKEEDTLSFDFSSDNVLPINKKEYIYDFAPKKEQKLPKAIKSQSKQIIQNPDECDKNGKSLLMLSIQEGNTEQIELLLESNANVNLQDNEGWTALMYCVRYQNDADLVKKLLDYSADYQIKTKYGLSLLDLCISYCDNLDVINQILSLYEKNSSEVLKSFTLLLSSTFYDEELFLQKIQLFLNNKISLNSLHNGKTPLMYLCQNNTSTNAIQLLLKYGANKELISTENKTAFDYASENKSLQKDDIYWSLN